MSSIPTNWSTLLAEWWGADCSYDWFIAPTNAANIIYGSNPPFQVSDFLAFYPKFGTGIQGLVAVQPSAGLSAITLDASAPTIGYNVNDLLQIVQLGGANGVAVVTSVGPEGQITGIAVQTPGVGYSVANSVPTTGGTGTGAVVNITAVASLGGSGYALNDSVQINQLGGTGGTALVTSIGAGGVVTGLQVQNQGNGYSVAAGLSTTGGTGSGLQVNITQITPFNPIVPLPVLQTFITLANAGLQYARWLEQWKFAMCLFVAHYATLYLQSEGQPTSTAAQVAQSGLQTGVIISKSVGDVSVSKEQIVAAHLEQFGSWLLTQPGQLLAQMASSVGAGMMLIY